MLLRVLKFVMKLFRQIELKVIYCTFSTSLTYFLLGYSYGLPSPISHEVKSANLLDDYQFGIFSGIFYVSAVISGFIATPMMYWLGRRNVIIISAIITAAGWIFICSSRIPQLMICGRVVTGLGNGISAPILPIYIGEVANKNTRGRHLGISSFQVSLGVLVIFILGTALSYFWLSVIATCISMLQVMMLLYIPYSPAYLAAIGLEKRALSTLENLRCKDYDVMAEVLEIIEAVKYQNISLATKISFLFKLHNIKAFTATITVMITIQISGINVFSSFSSELLANDLIDANILGIVYPLSVLIGNVVNVLLIEKLGRKFLMLLSYISMTSSLIIFGIYFFTIDVICPKTTSLRHLCMSKYLIAWPTICIVLFSFSFGIGIGTVGYILLGELIPLKIKHIVSSFGTFVQYITAYLLITSFPIITNYTPIYNYIFGVSLLSTILSLITLLLTPETRGKSVAELENLFVGKSIFIFDYE